jgi:DNA polymerase/3'-5' exonuclease PolX
MTKIKDFEELREHPELLNDKQKIGLKYYDDMNIRIPIVEGRQHFKIVHKILNNMYSGIEFEFVGSFRRKNKDLGDIDILIKNREGLILKDVIKQLENKSYIIEKLAQGNNKFMGICKLYPELPARRIDILIADPSYYYFALLYFTGSYSFNIYMRKIALKKGLSLSEYGFKNTNDPKNKNIIDTTDTIHSEEDIFKYLDMSFVEPHKR